MWAAGTDASSGTQRRTQAPCGSKRSALAHGIEDAEPGLRVGAHAGGPLPAAAVVGHVAVDEVAHEVSLTDAIVHQQVARQERRHHQARTVAEPARRRQLAHGRVHDGDTGATLAPGGDSVGILLLGAEG